MEREKEFHRANPATCKHKRRHQHSVTSWVVGWREGASWGAKIQSSVQRIVGESGLDTSTVIPSVNVSFKGVAPGVSTKLEPHIHVLASEWGKARQAAQWKDHEQIRDLILYWLTCHPVVYIMWAALSPTYSFHQHWQIYDNGGRVSGNMMNPGNQIPETSISVQIWVSCSAHKLFECLSRAQVPKSPSPSPVKALPAEVIQKELGRASSPGRTSLKTRSWRQEAGTAQASVPFCCLTSVPGAILGWMPSTTDQDSSRNLGSLWHLTLQPAFSFTGLISTSPHNYVWWRAHNSEFRPMLCVSAHRSTPMFCNSECMKLGIPPKSNIYRLCMHAHVRMFSVCY